MKVIVFPRARGLIETQDGESHLFSLEVADTPELRARGLMFREYLAPDTGMLLLWQQAREVAIWMENTLVPLDLLYINQNNEVVRIHTDTVPFDRTALPSGGPVVSVLEVRAGTAERLRLKAGDRFRLLP